MELKKNQRIVGLAAFLILWLSASFCLADTVTIIGEVNDTQQVVANGQIYEVADDKIGNDLVANYISAKVKVTGTVKETADMKIIHVDTFEVVPE
jgi:hypothetical protein